MKKSFFLLLLLLLLLAFGLATKAQSVIQKLVDSVGKGGYVDLASHNNQLFVLKADGGVQYAYDTGSGAATPYTTLAPLTPASGRLYNFSKQNFFSLNNRYPVFISNPPRMMAVSASSVPDTILTNATPSFGDPCLLLDSVALVLTGNKLYKTNLLQNAVLVDSCKPGSSFFNFQLGNGGLYYIRTTTAGGGYDSLVLFHYDGATRTRLYSINTSNYLDITGMIGNDLYLVEYSNPNIVTTGRMVVIKKVSPTGVVSTVGSLNAGVGFYAASSAAGLGKLWIPITNYNGNGVRNFYAVDPQSGQFTQATNGSGNNLMPYISPGSFSPDSFLYYGRYNPTGRDTLFRTKGTPATDGFYSIIDKNFPLDGFYDSVYTDQTYGIAYAFCGQYPIALTDSFSVGTSTGMVRAGLQTTSAEARWIKMGNAFYGLYGKTALRKASLLKYTGCGIPQIQLSVPETQYVFSAVNTFPNPSKGHFQVIHKGLNHEAKCRLISLDGKELPVRVATGAGVLEIDAAGAPAGLYILQVQQGKETFTQRLQIL